MSGKFSKLCLLFCFISSLITAQEFTVRGKIIDQNKQPLQWIHINLVDISDTTINHHMVSGSDGIFLFGKVPPSLYQLRATAVGRKSIKQNIQVKKQNVELGNLVMSEIAIQFGEMLIESRMPQAIQNGDTTDYIANSIKINRNATAEDLLAKLPGVIVNNGTITAGGETIQRVLVDGKPFFGDDPTLSVRNLPAEVVDKIQVFDQMSDQAQFTGFDDGQSIRTINVVTRRNRGGNLNFGKLAGGYGENNRYDAAGNINLFDGNRRLSFLGSSNNTNTQDFSMQDILGVIGSNSQVRQPGMGQRPGGNRGGGAGGGGGQRSGGFGRSGGAGSGSQLVGQQQGINTTSTLGTNDSDSLAKNLFMQASYFFNAANNQNIQLDQRQYFLGGDSTYLYNQSNNSNSKNYNHRINSRIDYAMDPYNSITVLPVLYFQSNNANSVLDAVTTQTGSVTNSQSNTTNNNNGYNVSSHFIFRHKFDLPGRTISADIGASKNSRTTNGLLSTADQLYSGRLVQMDSLSEQSFYNSDVKTISANIVYTEPTDVNSILQLSYSPAYTKNIANKNTYDFNPIVNGYTSFNSLLSNSYDNEYTTQSLGIGHRWHFTEVNLMLDLSYQMADLHGIDYTNSNGTISKKFTSLLPSILFNYTSSDHKTLRLFYRTSTSAPSITQLQQVVNNSNPLLLSTGNPDLAQSYSHSLMARYSLTAMPSATSMFIMLSGTYTNNYIATATLIPSRDTVMANGISIPQGGQLSYPVNLDGYWNIRSFFTYGFPFDLIRSTINFNTGITFAHTPGMLNKVKSISNSTSPSAGVVIGSNISQNFDFTISYAGSYTIATNSLQSTGNSNYYSHTASLKWVWEFWEGIVLNNQISNVYTSGLAQGYNQNIILWNISLGKKFLADEKGEIKLGVTDLLGQNKSVSRSVTSTYIDDTYNQVLPRYVILTFTYTMR